MSKAFVAKFGGTSLATPYSFRLAAERIRREARIKIVVASAPGKITRINNPDSALPFDDIKVTDRLLALSANARKGKPTGEDIALIKRRYEQIEYGLNLPHSARVSSMVPEAIANRIKRCTADNPTAPIAALGDELNAPLFANYLRLLGINAVYVSPDAAGILVSCDNGLTHIRPEDYWLIGKKLGPLLETNTVPVLSGFSGTDERKTIRTFKRGGSDYLGSVLAVEFGFNYLNFTDVDGIHVVEPEIEPDAPSIRTMSARELTELTLGGRFGVFQYEAAVPLAINEIKTHILNTFDGNAPGTQVLQIVEQRKNMVTGIVYRGDFVIFEIVKYGIANEVGILEEMPRMLASMGISIEHAPSSTNNISIIVRKENVEQTGFTIADIKEKIRRRIEPNSITVTEGIAAVALVGEQLPGSTETFARIFKAIHGTGVEVFRYFHEGITSVLWFRSEDGKKAAKALYKEFFN